MAENKNGIVLIGNGMASAECIKALRENGYNSELHVFTDSTWPIYNPMLTTYYTAGKIPFDQLFPFGNNNEFYDSYKVTVHSGSPVTVLNTEKKTVVNRDGFEIGYDQCLIASGATPFLPPIEGINSEKVYGMRTVEDAIALKEALDRKPRKALVVGASMVGIKVVELLYNAGVEVCLVDMADRIFPLAAHPDCSRIIENRLAQSGICLKFEACVNKVEETQHGIRACFDNEESEEADLLVMCIGVKANTSFIDSSQLETNRGILVDACMQTAIPDLYAAGDVCRSINLSTGAQQTIGLLANARNQGRIAGRNMAGIPNTFSGNIPHNITHFMGMDFVGIGDICEYDNVEQACNDTGFIQFFWKDGLLTGANFVHSYTESGVIKNAVIKGLLHQGFHYGNSSSAVQNLLIKRALAEVKKYE